MASSYCWIGPYNAHCFMNDKGEYMREDKSCYFCGTILKEDGTYISPREENE